MLACGYEVLPHVRRCIRTEGVREGPDRTQGTQPATEKVRPGRPSARALAEGEALVATLEDLSEGCSNERANPVLAIEVEDV